MKTQYRELDQTSLRAQIAPRWGDPIALRLCRLRRQQNLTQTALSGMLKKRDLNVTREMIANWETARSAVPAWILQFLAECLQTKVEQLLPACAELDKVVHRGVPPRALIQRDAS